MATLGWTTNGATNTNYNAGVEVISNLGGAMPEAGTLDSIHVYSSFSNNDTREAVGIAYSDTAGAPGARIALTAKTFGSSPAWITYTAGSESLSAAQYYAGMQMESAATNLFYDDSISGYNEYSYNGTWNDTTPNPSDPFGGSLTTANRRMSIYITYTPTATTTRGMPFNSGTAFNGGRPLTGIIR